MERRHFLKTAAALAACTTLSRPAGAEHEELPPVRQITRGPKHHWFAYYDKLEFDPTCRYVLGMETDFDFRSPEPDDVIRLGMVDLQEGDRWIELGQSRAWCWQQGCMLQWRPGSATEVLWNDREGDHYVCRILDVQTRALRTVDHPVYSVSPDGRWAVAPHFGRVRDCRPGYGYAGVPDPCADELAPKDSGIFRVDLETGSQQLVLSLADIVKAFPVPPEEAQAKHWFNHLLVNTDGTRFEFLHRWRAGKSFRTHMLTARPDGSDVRLIDPSGFTSHFIWRDPRHILAWSRHASHGDAFYLFEDRQGGKIQVVGKELMPKNGHCTYLPGNRWVLNDTYPDRDRKQHVYLYNVAENRRVPLGSFSAPREYSGEWRCDTHPRFSPNGQSVVIDSPHTSDGRQLHLIDIRRIVGT